MQPKLDTEIKELRKGRGADKNPEKWADSGPFL
jgi:hypothetical protein